MNPNYRLNTVLFLAGDQSTSGGMAVAVMHSRSLTVLQVRYNQLFHCSSVQLLDLSGLRHVLQGTVT